MDFHIVIPARYASTRLPGKPLAKLAGKALIQHVVERAREAGAASVAVATDDYMVRDACQQFGVKVVMTSRRHESGTDRIAEAVAQLALPDDAIVVNLQGDEPLMPAALPRQAAALLAEDPDAGIATLCAPLEAPADFRNPNVVKLVMNAKGEALYFSRAPVPHPRDGGADAVPRAFRHIGLYAYRVAALKAFTQAEPCELEQTEKLEQLRALWLGVRIRVALAEARPGRGVDTEEDLRIVEKQLNERRP